MNNSLVGKSTIFTLNANLISRQITLGPVVTLPFPLHKRFCIPVLFDGGKMLVLTINLRTQSVLSLTGATGYSNNAIHPLLRTPAARLHNTYNSVRFYPLDSRPPSPDDSIATDRRGAGCLGNGAVVILTKYNVTAVCS